MRYEEYPRFEIDTDKEEYSHELTLEEILTLPADQQRFILGPVDTDKRINYKYNR